VPSRGEPHEIDPATIAGKPLFAPPSFFLDPRAAKLIISEEVGGVTEKEYWPYRHPEWPGGSSGVTIGIGWDCGYNTADTILRVWRKSGDKLRLVECAGIRGVPAKSKAREVKDIVIPWTMANDVFQEDTVPRFYQQMKRAFPGVEDLDPVAQGAILSVVFNRGPSLVGDSRVDMREIARYVPSKNYYKISNAIRHMNVTMGTTWKRQGVYEGLSKRRIAEAELVESCIK
jgi:GH24 family phage-related lysozyme (muramidase)